MRTRRRTVAGALGTAACAVVSAAVLAGCGEQAVDAGRLTAADRKDAQAALDALRGTNIPSLLISTSDVVENPPSTCRVHLVSMRARTFRVYVFWVPYLGSESYTWLDMTLSADASRDRFHLGTEEPVLPGGHLSPNGRSVEPRSVDTTLLSLYGAQQKRRTHEVLVTHAGNVFSKPGAGCRVLMNGSLRIIPGR